jgi:hypothetical protein
MATTGNAIVELVITQEQVINANNIYRMCTLIVPLHTNDNYLDLTSTNYEDKLTNVNSSESVQRIRMYFTAGGKKLRLINLALNHTAEGCAFTGETGTILLTDGHGSYTDTSSNTISFDYILLNNVLTVSNSSDTSIIANDSYTVSLAISSDSDSLTITDLFGAGNNFLGQGAGQPERFSQTVIDLLLGNLFLDNMGSLTIQKTLADRLIEDAPARAKFLNIFKALSSTEYNNAINAGLKFANNEVCFTHDSKWLLYAVFGQLNNANTFVKSEYNTQFNAILGTASSYDDTAIELSREQTLGFYGNYTFFEKTFAGNLVTMGDNRSLSVWFIREALINDVKAATTAFLFNNTAKMRNEDFRRIALTFDSVLERYLVNGLIAEYSATTFTNYEDLSTEDKQERVSRGYKTTIRIPDEITKVVGEIKESN